MSKTWFPIQNGLIDRHDLNIFEKMCSIVMARYADKAEFDHLLTIEAIAKKMGCSKEETERAIIGLIQKGLLDLEDAGSEQILHQASIEAAKPITFNNIGKQSAIENSVDVEAPKVSKPAKADFDSLTSSLYDIIEEKINDREARIILNFGNHDLELIEKCYRTVKASGTHDVMEALLEALQSTDKKPVSQVKETSVSEMSDEVSGISEVSEVTKAMSDMRSTMTTVEPKVGGQINLVNINKMKLYKEMADKNKKKTK